MTATTTTEPEQKVAACGHSANGNGFSFVCDLPAGHTGLHQQTTQLYQGPSRTNWGDDGLARHATKGRYDEQTRKWTPEKF